MESDASSCAVEEAVLPHASDGARVLLVGVEHLSDVAATRVTAAIEREKPSTVLLELCGLRALALAETLRTRGHNRAAALLSSAAKTFPDGGGFPGISVLVMMYCIHKQVAPLSELISEPYGEEFVAGALAADRVGASITLGDRNVMLTLARANASIGLRELSSAFVGAVGGVQVAPLYSVPVGLSAKLAWRTLRGDWEGVGATLREIDGDAQRSLPSFYGSPAGAAMAAYNRLLLDIAQGAGAGGGARSGTEGGSVGATLEGTPRASPQQRRELQSALRALLDESAALDGLPAAVTAERDVILAHALRRCGTGSVVAVVGRAHVAGVQREWAAGCPTPVEPLLQAPPWGTARALGLPALAMAGAAVGARALWRRSRPAFVAALAAGTTAAAGGALLVQRLEQAGARLQAALAAPQRDNKTAARPL